MQHADKPTKSEKAAESKSPDNKERNTELDTIAEARKRFDGFKIKKIDPTVHRELAHGWMLKILMALDDWLWKRWDYWYICTTGNELPESPIPRIDFLATPHPGTRKMIEASLDCIPNHGGWQSWESWRYMDYFLDWLLYGLGHLGQKTVPEEPQGCGGASNRLYQVFMLDAMLLWPHDYFGTIFSENAYGRKQGFFPTPHHLCEAIVRMTFGDGDHRRKSMMDPCVGTGRFPLHASNHTLRIYGMDIDPTLCKATLVNGFLYSPWVVRPIAWLDFDLAVLSRPHAESAAQNSKAQSLSDKMADAAPPHAQPYLAGSEHDGGQQYRYSPILKRRRRKEENSDQGSLF